MISGKVKRFFGDESPMRRLAERDGFEYEPRPQQAEMSAAVARAFDKEENLCVEAPTGVGKTFAYLVPAVLYARERKRPVIVSTDTIALQEQIMSHDMPLISRMLDRPVKAVVSKGAANYLCLRRLDSIVDLNQGLLMFEGHAGELARLHEWTGRTATGDRDDITFQLSKEMWGGVCCEAGNCAGASCKFHQRCFLHRARRKAQGAEIIVYNHAKLFASLAADRKNAANGGEGAESALPDYAALVLDEAHTIADTASSFLGLRVQMSSIRKMLNRLHNPERKSGLLWRDGSEAARSAADIARAVYDRFLDTLEQRIHAGGQAPTAYSPRKDGRLENRLAAPLQSLRQALISEAARTRDEKTVPELLSLLDRLADAIADMDSFFGAKLSDCVYWMEKEGANDVSLNAAPVDVAPLLRASLFDRKPVVLTSATLAVDGSMSYFQKRTGCEGARTLSLDSPFDYQRQVTLYLARNMPDPNDRYMFPDAAKLQLERFLDMTHGRAFVLFTSYSFLKDMAARLSQFFQSRKINILAQGAGLSRKQMLESFKSTPNSVIFGTDSFWTGVDVPGEALSNVVITKLPFSVPEHPLVKARTDRIEAAGASPFEEFSVPEAILKFRQGFGRLIRRSSDHGIVVVLDPRILTKGYGRKFLDSIPKCNTVIF